MLNLPYNFVPLSRAIFQPAWGSRASHDHPFREGLSGELDLRITVETPLCVGGRQTKPSATSPGAVDFFRTPDNKLAIPGSSIKGMLRSIVEIASFAHFQQVDDIRMGVRDISKADNFYSKAMNRTPVNTGWLNFTDGRWYITPCSMERVEQEMIIDFFSIPENEWNRNKTAAKRYRLLNGIREVAFTKKKNNDKGERVLLVAPPAEPGQDAEQVTEGYLVVTGQPGADFRRSGAKKRDFIFYDSRGGDTKEVRDNVMADFMFIHEDGDEWPYWKGLLAQNPPSPGIPVFYHEDSRGVRSLGLARMYRLAYENTVHDAIANTNKAHVQSTSPDLAQLIFGQIDEHEPTGENNLRGRLNVSLAEIDEADGEHGTTETDSMVLSSPKPTFYPAYVDQRRGRSNQSYKTMMDKDVELSGWKRYPARDDADAPPMSDLVAKNPRVQVRLETVGRGASFCAKVRFHNLLPAELGAILWASDFGKNPHARHSLGTGKPFGFGQVEVKAEPTLIRSNQDTSEANRDAAVVADASRAAFGEVMQRFWIQARPDDDDSDWTQSPQIVQLLAMADPYIGRGRNWEYPTGPQRFMQAKQTDEVLERYVDPGDSKVGAEAVRGEFKIAHVEDFTALVETRQEEIQREQQQEQRLQEKETMSESERLLADLEDYLQPEEWTKSAFSRLEDHLRKKILKTPDDCFEPSERERLLALAKSGHDIAVEHDKTKTGLGKALVKLFKKLDAEPPR